VTASPPAVGRRVYVQEVSPRDGFQMESRFIPTAKKIAFINALSATGVAKIEATSFTSPQAIPSLSDADEVMNGIERRTGVIYTVLVPNVRGAERALRAKPDELNLVTSCSESHSAANLRMTRAQSQAVLASVITMARDACVGSVISLSCAFGCPIEGDVPASTVFDTAARFIDDGATGIALCDTTGMAFPTQVRHMTRAFRARWPATPLTLHFHDTRGMGLANVMAALEAGADRFDASAGGVGGCPYAPGASGNVCTEDMVHMLELCGHRTGVDLDALVAAARTLPELLGHDVPSQLVKAGPRLGERKWEVRSGK
jgi:hydroxymethylglutaryl-CoA lyase